MIPANRWLAGTLLGLGGATALVFWQATLTYDLTYFLPEPTTSQQQVLVERLGQGAGTRLIFAEITTPYGVDASMRAAQLADSLSRSPRFLRVEDGRMELNRASVPEPIWRWRFLLADIDWSELGIRRALEARLADLATFGSPELAALIASDPLGTALTIFERLRFAGGALRWSDGPQRAFMVLETVAPPFDSAAQNDALAEIGRAHRTESGGDTGLELYGVGVYGARMEATIQKEAQLLGTLATCAVLGVVILAYRSIRLTLISMLPLASAILGGVLASTLIFGEIHGITVAFGATLVGVVDDYPLHLFSHARHVAPHQGVKLIFRTLLASAGTAIVAYAALVVSGSRGLAQLGVFSLTGIACAMLVTCAVLPQLMHARPPATVQDPDKQQFALLAWIWLPLAGLALAAFYATGGIRFSDDLAGLTPLPASLLAKDQLVRQRFGAPDIRYLVSINAGSVESILQKTEALEAKLDEARRRGLISSWSSVSVLLPSAAAQERRRAAIPAPDILAARIAAASADMPFRHDAFQPFLEDVAAVRNEVPIRSADLAEGSLGDYVRSRLTKTAHGWRSVVFLSGLTSPTQMGEWLRRTDGEAELIDLKRASEALMRSYRLRLTSILVGALGIIAVLVAWSTRDVRRFLWSGATIAASVLSTLAIVNWLWGAVSLFNIVALILVAGLGVDYCLFFSRPGVSRTEFRDTRHAVAACAASTAGAFAILGTSSIPLLSTIGMTVAIGTATMFLAARAGCRPL